MTLPSGWQEAPLSDVCDVIAGATPKSGVAHYWGGYIRWITPNDLSKDRSQTIAHGERTLSRAGYDSCSARLFPAGSVIVSSRAPIGYVAIAGAEMCTNQGCKTAVPPEFIDSRYLYWFLLAAKPDLEARASGTTFKEISAKRFGETRFWWPELDEQRRIVDLLEDHLSRLDAADREVVRASEKLGALWRSALTATRDSFSADPRAIGDIASTSLGKMLDAKKQSGEPIPYLRNINVRWGSFDLADLQTTPLEPNEVAKFDVRAGDIMVCEGGEPGRCAVWRGDGSGIAFQKALHRIRVGHRAEVFPDFLALMLEEYVRSGRADRLFTGTTIKHLPQEKLRTIEIVLPSLDDQQAALQRLGEVAEARERLRSSLVGTMRTSQALRRSLLKAAFSGRLTGAESDLSAAEEMIGA